MTEDEAKTRWCPFANCAGDRGNRDADGFRPKGKCIGSACMAWRWFAQTRATDGSWNVHETDEWEGYRSDAKEGYCGLAGRS